MTKLEQAKNLAQCRICEYNSFTNCNWRNLPYFTREHISIIPKRESASYGDFKETSEPTKDCYLMCELMEGSDYSNGRIVQASNLKAFLEEFKNCSGVHKVYGGHNTFGIAVKIDCLTEEMIEIFTSLEDYPLLDEELMSDMELEEQNEAWESWVQSDFQSEIEKHLKIDINDIGKRFDELFHHLTEEANEYWFEDGCSQYIQLEPIAQECTEKLLTEYEVTFTKEN